MPDAPTTAKPGAVVPAPGGTTVPSVTVAGDVAGAEPNGVESTTSGAGTLDDSSLYFVRLIVVVVWTVYLIPIIAKFIGRKQSKWQRKLKSGWETLKGDKSIKEMPQ